MLEEAGHDFLRLSWDWPDAPRAQYEIELRWAPRESAGSAWERQRIPGATSNFRHTVRGLSSGTAYTVVVHALPAPGSGTTARKSPELNVQTIGGDDELQLELRGRTASSIELGWRGGGGGASHFVVYGNEALGFKKVYGGAERQCTISSLVAGKDYGFTVHAMNAQGAFSASSNELIARCAADDARNGGGSPDRRLSGGGGGGGGGGSSPRYGGGSARGPPQPQLLTLDAESLSIKWEPPSGGAQRYIVELAQADDGRQPSEDDWDLIYEDASAGCEISCLTPQTDYYMRLAYVDMRGVRTGFGPVLHARTPDASSPPPKQKKAGGSKAKKGGGVRGGGGGSSAKQQPSPRQPSPRKPSPAQPPPRKTSPRPSSPRKESPRRQPPTPRQQSPRPASPRQQQQQRRPGSASGGGDIRGGGGGRSGSPRPTSPRRPPPPSQQARSGGGGGGGGGALRTPRRPPKSPRAPPSRAPPSGESDESGGSSGGGGGGGDAFSRLHAMHAAKLERAHEAREESQRRFASMSSGDVSARRTGASSPRGVRPPSPRGGTFSSSPRGDLWTGRFTESVIGGGTFDSASSRLSQAADEGRPSSPGPGAYDPKPSAFGSGGRQTTRGRATSSAFASGSVRLLTRDGEAVSPRSRSPGVRHYDVIETTSIAYKAQQLVRRTEKANARSGGPSRSASTGQLRNRFDEVPEEKRTPGPGAYDAFAPSAQDKKKKARAHNSAFNSGSVRSMPWEPVADASDANRHSTTSRVHAQKEEAMFNAPGPGEYDAAPTACGGRLATTASASTFGRSSSPRFEPPPPLERLTPSPMHYQPSRTQ